MNILIFVNSLLPVTKYGGTQRVMWDLGKELSHMGHKVYFLARRGSTCSFATVLPYNPEESIDAQIPDDIDIVHLNNMSQPTRKPHIVTYHGNHITKEIDINAVFVSGNHAQRHGSRSYVYNGLDWDAYGPVDINAARTHYHFLGKAAWKVKNVRGAINVVKALPGARLYVLGGTRLNLKMGFRLTLTPKARFMGMVGTEEKAACMQHSKGLIFPVIWENHSGSPLPKAFITARRSSPRHTARCPNW